MSGMCAPPRPAEKGLPRPVKKQVLPRPAKIGKSCGAGRGKVDSKYESNMPAKSIPSMINNMLFYDDD